MFLCSGEVFLGWLGWDFLTLALIAIDFHGASLVHTR